MRIGNRLEDLANQFEHDEQQERLLLARQLERAEKSTVDLASRLPSAEGSILLVTLKSGKAYEGELQLSGKDWFEIYSSQSNIKIFIPIASLIWFKGELVRKFNASPEIVLLPVASRLETFRENKTILTLHIAGRELRGRILSIWKDHLEFGLDLKSNISGYEKVTILTNSIEAIVGNWQN